MKNTDDWLNLFDNTKENFKWFFLGYGFEMEWMELEEYRKMGEDGIKSMLNIMNKVWFLLPDSEFNIIANPAGWKDFLTLIEKE
jgi:hypothetical protein